MTSSIYVPYSGRDKAEVLVVGESPGSNETRLRQPFVGQSGELLRTALQQNGFACATADECEKGGIRVNDNYNIKFANLVCYQPEDNKFNNFTEAEVKLGISNLEKYINQNPPKIIIALGNYPLQYLAHKYGIDNWRGSVISNGGIHIIPTYHPAYILRSRSEYPIFSFDLSKAKRILDNGFQKPKFDFIIDPDAYQFEEALAEIKQHGIVAVDIETIKHTNQILCCGFAISKFKAWCLINRFESGLDPEFRRFCTTILEDPTIKKIYHNGLYDVEVFHNNMIESGIDHDTMVMQHVLNPEFPRGLDFITSVFTDISYYKDKGKMTLPENEKGWSNTKNLDRLTLYEYNSLDCCATYWCFEEMLKEIEADENFSLIYPQEMSMHEVAFELIRNGMPIDEGRRLEIKKRIESKFVEDQRMLNAIVGRDINVGSSPQKKKLLYEEWGLPEKTNKKKQVAADADALISLISFVKDKINSYVKAETKYEWQKKLAGIMLIMKIQGYRKLLGSYIDIKIHPDGRIRSSYSITGANTGRWSCSKYIDDTGLNAQTMPRESV